MPIFKFTRNEENEEKNIEKDAFFTMEETADEKRLRMTKNILNSLAKPDEKEENEENEEENEEIKEKGLFAVNEQDLINKKLKLAYLEKQGKIFREYIPELTPDAFTKNIKFYKGHKKTVTCLEISKDGKNIFSGGKDCCILQWDAETGKKNIFKGEKHNREIQGHFDEILTIALSEDNKTLISGGKDRIIRVWDIHNQKLIHSFKGHKDTITGISVDPVTDNFYSISYDRTLKMWNLAERAYIDTYYGHKREALTIDSFYKDRVITGGADGQAILWKLSDETQLLYKSNCQTIDCVHTISEKYFVSSGDDSTLELWTAAKKTPIFSLPKAHVNAPWICSLTGLKNSDVLASGSIDGFINIYKFDQENQRIETLKRIPMNGSINAMKFSENGRMLVCAQGDEQRLGRWIVKKDTKPGINIFTNLLHIYKFSKKVIFT